MSDAAARPVEAFRSLCGDDLRDLWVLNHHGYEHLHVREDVSDILEYLDISQFIDNERFGYVTRGTYETLYYTDYDCIVCRLDSFEQLRIFVGDRPTGILAGFGRGVSCNFAALHDHVYALNDEFDGANLFNNPTVHDRLP